MQEPTTPEGNTLMTTSTDHLPTPIAPAAPVDGADPLSPAVPAQRPLTPQKPAVRYSQDTVEGIRSKLALFIHQQVPSAHPLAPGAIARCYDPSTHEMNLGTGNLGEITTYSPRALKDHRPLILDLPLIERVGRQRWSLREEYRQPLLSWDGVPDLLPALGSTPMVAALAAPVDPAAPAGRRTRCNPVTSLFGSTQGQAAAYELLTPLGRQQKAGISSVEDLLLFAWSLPLPSFDLVGLVTGAMDRWDLSKGQATMTHPEACALMGGAEEEAMMEAVRRMEGQNLLTTVRRRRLITFSLTGTGAAAAAAFLTGC